MYLVYYYHRHNRDSNRHYYYYYNYNSKNIILIICIMIITIIIINIIIIIITVVLFITIIIVVVIIIIICVTNYHFTINIKISHKLNNIATIKTLHYITQHCNNSPRLHISAFLPYPNRFFIALILHLLFFDLLERKLSERFFAPTIGISSDLFLF